MDKNTKPIAVFWFRRDLRLNDNVALSHALKQNHPVLPIFIFDSNITSELPKNDARITFIHQLLDKLQQELKNFKSGISTYVGNPIDVWKTLVNTHNIKAVFTNEDYEPYAIQRDQEIAALLQANGIEFNTFKDQVIFAKNEILKADGKPYTVFTPYKKLWLSWFSKLETIESTTIKTNNFLERVPELTTLRDLGFLPSEINVKDFDIKEIGSYGTQRDFPYKDSGSYLGPHLRFGSVSVRQIIKQTIQAPNHEVFLSELIWREFFMQILYHFPKVVDQSFRAKYDRLKWRNNSEEFKAWKNGKTGYPLVDAGIRQLNQTGYMHNRVRMVVASFLCKHLLIDWRWGEAYFAEKLLDYDLSANNGNWQWVAGTGCDAAPYFRIFNPTEQAKKFDTNLNYIKQWVPELNTSGYPNPIIDHKLARSRALKVYKDANEP